MSSLETYITELRDSRHVAVNETSYYGALAHLFNEVGGTLKPKVRYVITPKGQGAGLPDGGLYTAQQLKRGTEAASIETTPPERGCVEAKGLSEEVERIAAREQVRKYLNRYGQVLVTNYRDFLLVGRDEGGQPVKLERYTLAGSEAEFWTATANPQLFAREHGERFAEYLKRVMLHAAPLAAPEDVARFLASYARDAKARMEKSDLPALASVRAALEEALGLKFVGADGEHFFRSTLVQTIFYGVFSAWVLWTQQNTAGSMQKFDWRSAAWSLRVPMIRALFEQLLTPTNVKSMGLVEVLDWAGMTLNRIEDPAAFIRKFTEGHAVQYFYEPFLQEFDPELRKQLGVWYTPSEIVKYMVARVDTVLREELGVADGLANEQVYVLDPCCGTGAYLVEVLRRIEATLKERGEDALAGESLKQAAMNRVFGFEILPAPFVVAHLQLGLLLQNLDAPLSETGAERVGVYLTNALTGWEPAKEPKTRLLFPELEEERERAEEVKRERKILVVIGNPPYNAFAGTSPAEEQGLVEPYKKGLISEWGIKKFNLDDLYVRFFRIAERRIAEKTGRGVVCFISNHSWISDPSFVVMRKHLLESFDRVWIENMHGNRQMSEYAPDGRTSETIFAIPSISVGIKQGVAISLLVKNNNGGEPEVLFRNDINEASAVERRAHLLRSLKASDFNAQYGIANPKRSNRLSLRTLKTSDTYLTWPSLEELSGNAPMAGFLEARRGSFIDIDKNVLDQRMQMYFDPKVDWKTLEALNTSLTNDLSDYRAKEVRAKVLATSYEAERLRRYTIRPFDNQWCYLGNVSPMWNRSRPELYAQCWPGNSFLITRMKTEKEAKGSPIYYSSTLVDYQTIARNVSVIPLRLRNQQGQTEQAAQNHFFAAETHDYVPTANLSAKARAYLASLGIEKADEDADAAALVWMHALAIGYAPAYLSENADGIRGDWPRIPLPATADALRTSAALGRKVAAILAHDAGDAAAPPAPQLRGIINTPLRPEMKVIGVVSRVGGGQLRVSEGELALNANWGFATQKGVMPGKGRIVERAYTAEERAAIEAGAAALGLDPAEAFARLGATALDVYLNDMAYWRCVPARVWNYHIGGYQVVKKWLSYRERAVLKRDLTPAESGEVRDMMRRISALLLLEPALDANYDAVTTAAYAWPPA